MHTSAVFVKLVDEDGERTCRELCERDVPICRSSAVQSRYRKNYQPKTIGYECCDDYYALMMALLALSDAFV